MDCVRVREVGDDHAALNTVVACQFFGESVKYRSAPGDQDQVEPSFGQLTRELAAYAFRCSRHHGPRAVAFRERSCGRAHFATLMSITISLASPGTLKEASPNFGARNVGRTLLETPQASVGMPTKFVSTCLLPLRSCAIDTA